MKAHVAAIVLAIPALAYADQCELVDDAVATSAIDAIRAHGQPKLIEYCEPCGDKAPGEPHVIEHVAKQRATDGYFEVTIDKREVDLAYTYVQTAPSTYENLAMLAHCPTSGVRPSLTVTDATDTGVLIMPSDAPVAAAVPPPTTVIIHTEDRLNLWAIVAACIASSGLWAFATITLLRRRRTVAMRPRAIEMIASLPLAGEAAPPKGGAV
jgi:hypothetical protein